MSRRAREPAPAPRRACRLVAPLLVALGLIGAAAIAEARPGGGHSFSSSSSSSSYSSSSSSSSSFSSSSWSSSDGSSGRSSSSSSSSGRPRQNFVISEHTPVWDAAIMGMFGLFVALGVGAWVARGILRARREAAVARQIGGTAAADMLRAGGLGSALRGWSARPRPRGARADGAGAAVELRPARGRRRRARLRDLDPDFSRVAFEDLAFRIYATAYRLSTRGSDLDAIAPYLTAEIRAQVRATNWKNSIVDNVVVGALVFGRVDNEGEYMTIHVRYEANVAYSGMARPYVDYLRERWTFRRKIGATTRPPAETLALGCPSCGAPFVSSDLRRCDHCDTIVDDARFGWQVFRVERLAQVPQPPAVGHSVVEVGTDDPTIVQADLDAQLAALAADDPGFSLAAVEARARTIFAELGAAWNDGDLPRMRPVLSDALFDYMRYWIDAYDAQGLRNRVDDGRVLRVEAAKAARDRYFQAITLRVFADGCDYTVDADDRVISGSRRERRVYSEYWTLIRSNARPARRSADGQCPSCGAPLALTMAGSCDHCGVHLTLGEFDWVLSKIEQDEVYRG
ncbi:MAG: TIM44-like domain-containing protein [Nannocystaceae bacterium]